MPDKQKKIFQSSYSLEETKKQILNFGFKGKLPIFVGPHNFKFVVKCEESGQSTVKVWVCINGYISQPLHPKLMCNIQPIDGGANVICREVNSFGYYFVMVGLGLIFSVIFSLPKFTLEEFFIPVMFFLIGIGGIVLFERLYVQKKVYGLLKKTFSVKKDI